MRLLNAHTLLLKQFVGDYPPYAILSHTWTGEEVKIQSLREGTYIGSAGATKIHSSALQAQRDNLEWIWIDTCCIDQRSSSEVSEAINSMFTWFRNAAKCYVYLSDVSGDDWESSFAQSRWFTRSWTLLELLAPRSVEFFSKEWRRLGDKISMLRAISAITGIPDEALQGSPMSSFSAAEHMSWATHRTATLSEDTIYSLLGLFDVYMPILYGEGRQRALKRIQDEIRRTQTTTATHINSTGMRLLVAGSNPLRLTTVPVDEHLRYVILSHTWAEDEVSFEDMRIATATQRKGYSKIQKCCDLAYEHGFAYVWVDTCCIDKSSSSELQEAICSMYKWYKNASICYVYLDDYSKRSPEAFGFCKWFRRGWTLQELIAPSYVEFYDKSWNAVGTKHDLCDEIAYITSIDHLVLRGANPTSRTIAERMSWAAGRSTTRVEDVAYSLMGLFNVFMPMLYGEGSRAFIRLQEEIIKQTEDYTIFAWKDDAINSYDTYRGIFAHSPAEFAAAHSEHVVPRVDHPDFQLDQHSPPVLNSRGLVLTLPVLRRRLGSDACLGWVACTDSHRDSSEGQRMLLCILLREIQSSPQIFARISSNTLESRPMTDLQLFKPMTICVLPSKVTDSGDFKNSRTGEVLVQPPSNQEQGTLPQMQTRLAGWGSWAEDQMYITYSRPEGTCLLAVIHFDFDNGGFLVVIGFHDDMPWCSILTRGDFREQGDLIDRLFDVDLTSMTPTRFTDRVEKMLSGASINIIASIRVARPTPSTASSFVLGVYTENVPRRKLEPGE